MSGATKQQLMIAGSKGVAAIEFLVILPLLLFAFFGTVNLSQYIAVNRKMNTAAELVLDLVARNESTIASTAIDDYFIAAELSVRPIDVSSVRVDVYDYYIDQGTARRRWSKSSPNGTSCTQPVVNINDSNNVIGKLLNAGTSDVLVAVVCTPFTPPADFSIPEFPGTGPIFNGLTIEKTFILMPRKADVLACTGCS